MHYLSVLAVIAVCLLIAPAMFALGLVVRLMKELAGLLSAPLILYAALARWNMERV